VIIIIIASATRLDLTRDTVSNKYSNSNHLYTGSYAEILQQFSRSRNNGHVKYVLQLQPDTQIAVLLNNLLKIYRTCVICTEIQSIIILSIVPTFVQVSI